MGISEKALDFVKNQKGHQAKKVSILEAYKSDIFYLKDNNIPVLKILEFLEKEQGIKTTYQNLSTWIKRQSEYKDNSKNVKENKKEAVELESKNKLSKTTDSDIQIKKYPTVDGGLLKHNLKDLIVRPKF